jgi:hypothetical protein
MLIKIRDLFDPGHGIRDGKLRIRDPILTSRIRKLYLTSENVFRFLPYRHTNSKNVRFNVFLGEF